MNDSERKKILDWCIEQKIPIKQYLDDEVIVLEAVIVQQYNFCMEVQRISRKIDRSNRIVAACCFPIGLLAGIVLGYALCLWHY